MEEKVGALVRAKFECYAVDKDGENEVVRFRAVTTGSKDNEAWSKWTPAGDLSMTINNPAAQGKFEAGKEYYLDLFEGVKDVEAVDGEEGGIDVNEDKVEDETVEQEEDFKTE